MDKFAQILLLRMIQAYWIRNYLEEIKYGLLNWIQIEQLIYIHWQKLKMLEKQKTLEMVIC